MFNVRTDLAIEAATLLNKSGDELSKIDGVNIEKDTQKNLTVTTIKITNQNGEKEIGKKIGTYITIECPKIKDNDDDAFNDASLALCDCLKKLINVKKDDTVLVVGLGNWNITPDALGPKVVSNLVVTRHLFENIPEHITQNLNSLCAISPGVLGITGIETGEIAKGICDRIKPDLIIAIDALASRKIERISTTIQLSDTGITPGSGIGNKRIGFTKEYFNVPVIAIGVPTVVDAATVANDTIEILCENLKQNSSLNKDIGKMLELTNNDLRYPLIKEVLKPYIGELIVTPKDVDQIIDNVSKIIANGINGAVHNTMENLKSWHKFYFINIILTK